MTQQQFDDGYKLLTRFFKDIGRYNDFIKITAKYDRKFKQKLKNEFDLHKTNPLSIYPNYYHTTWNNFFDYKWFVGDDWQLYNDNALNNLRKQWQNFLIEKNFDGLNYIK